MTIHGLLMFMILFHPQMIKTNVLPSVIQMTIVTFMFTKMAFVGLETMNLPTQKLCKEGK